MVREAITVSGSARRVSTVGLRLKGVSGSAPLTVTLETASGSRLATATIAASSVSSGRWVTASFDTDAVLKSGSSYDLRLSTSTSGRYTVQAIYQGSSYGAWSPQTYFGDGRAQVTSGGGWSNWSGRSDLDLQFYLR